MAPVRSHTAGFGWRSMEPSSKFLTVNRWSFISLPWLTTLTILSLLHSHAGLGANELWPGAIVAAVSCVVGSLAVHTNSKLRLDPHPRGAFWMRWGLIGHAAALAACIFILIVGPESWSGGTLLATGTLFFTLLTAFLPFLPYRFLLTLISLIVAVWISSSFFSFNSAVYVATYGALFAAAVFFTEWYSRAMIETERSRRLEAQLSAAEERLRLSQDLHDTMGQHLAAMTIKTQLAQALAARHDPRVEEELAELYQLTQTAAADMRHVVNSYRTPDLDVELAGAKHVLSAAGTAVTVRGSSTDFPIQLRETAAWFVREAATNVLRHSQAKQVTIDITSGALTIANDNPEPTNNPGAGLEGLRRRAAQHDAYLEVEQTPETFTVSLKVDA